MEALIRAQLFRQQSWGVRLTHEAARPRAAKAHAQPDAILVIQRLNSRRAAIMERLVQRLDDDRRLRQVLHQARAVDLLVAATAFEGRDQIVTTRHRSAASASAMIAKFASRPS